MDTFSEVYEKSVEILDTQQMDASWKDIESGLKMMLKADGPNAGHATALEHLRAHLHKATKKNGSAVAKANEILVGAKNGVLGFQTRAALIKTMQHFYLVEKKGNQNIWVIDPPKSLAAWPYDLFAGKTEAGIKADLMQEDEIFGSENRQMMSDALQLARKWSMDVQIKLANADDQTLAIVKRWFHLTSDDKQVVQVSASILLNGFKKIVNACNSSNVTFSDLPHMRDDFEADGTIAAVADGENRPVIYLFKEFLNIGRPNKMGVIPKLWLCALTIVHELSHSLQKTEDIKYDYEGLNVSASFSTKDALKNADSWAHFAADMVGALPESDMKKALKK